MLALYCRVKNGGWGVGGGGWGEGSRVSTGH